MHGGSTSARGIRRGRWEGFIVITTSEFATWSYKVTQMIGQRHVQDMGEGKSGFHGGG